ncbi:MAG: hypothetical protein ACTSRW_13875 [Candidatus Helarchaeota archaeon]
MSEKNESFVEWFRKDDWYHVIVGFTLAYLWGVILEFTGAWYMMFVAGAIGGIFSKVGWKSFLVGFLGVLLSWLTIFWLQMLNGSFLSLMDVLTNVIGSMLGITIPAISFFIVALLLGGILGGVGALNGGYLTSIILQLSKKDEQ